MQIAPNKVVAINYTLTDPQGKVLDTSDGREPLVYLHGRGGLIPGLESELEGKSAGEKLAVVVPPEKGYGLKDEAMIQSVPRSAFAGVADITPGTQFEARSPEGMRVVTVVEADDKNVRVDANHPLAGVTLRFDVEIVDVRDASPEEMSHGHVHGAGGHQH
jgi:FKBP-type peptidyl-prolyl cis-trans isomerase SlyD